MKRKKIFIIGISLICMLVLLCSCGKKDNDDNSSSEIDKTQEIIDKIKITGYYTEYKDFIVTVENNNDFGVSNLEVTSAFYDEDDEEIEKFKEYIQYIDANSEYVFEINYGVPNKFKEYKINVTLGDENTRFKSYKKNISISSKLNNDRKKVMIEATNNSGVTLDFLDVGVLFYYNDKIVGYKNSRSYDKVKPNAVDPIEIYYPISVVSEYIEFNDYKVIVNYAYEYSDEYKKEYENKNDDQKNDIENAKNNIEVEAYKYTWVNDKNRVAVIVSNNNNFNLQDLVLDIVYYDKSGNIVERAKKTIYKLDANSKNVLSNFEVPSDFETCKATINNVSSPYKDYSNDYKKSISYKENDTGNGIIIQVTNNHTKAVDGEVYAVYYKDKKAIDVSNSSFTVLPSQTSTVNVSYPRYGLADVEFDNYELIFNYSENEYLNYDKQDVDDSSNVAKNIDIKGYRCVNGDFVTIIENKNSSDVYHVNLLVNFYDENKNVLSNDTWVITSIAANTKTAQKFTRKVPDNCTSYDIQIEVGQSDTVYDFANDLEVTSTKESDDIAVKLQNNSDKTVETIAVYVVYYKNGEVIGATNAYDSNLTAGKSITKYLRFPEDERFRTMAFDDYKVFLQAYSIFKK